MKKVIAILLTTCLLLPTYVSAETVIGTSSGAPVGSIIIYTGTDSDQKLLEKGYMVADGRSVSKQDYAELCTVLGTTYGEGNDTTCVLPDLKGRTVVGYNSSESEFNTLGKKDGEKTVVLNLNQIPSHSHTFNITTSESGAHTHAFSTGGTALTVNATSSHSGMALASGFSSASGSGWWTGVNKNVSSIASSGAHTHTFSGTTSKAGDDGAHNNLQPYITLKYIIKVK